eukprot:SAG31_NODE_1689_length_7525_cov_3.264745_9_plen_289_part_00
MDDTSEPETDRLANDWQYALAEVQALASIFSASDVDGFRTSCAQLQAFVDSGGDDQFIINDLPDLHFDLRIGVEIPQDSTQPHTNECHRAVLCLSCSLPRGYPSTFPAIISASIQHLLVRRADVKELNALLGRVAAASLGQEAVYEITEVARDWVADRVRSLERADEAARDCIAAEKNRSVPFWQSGCSLVRSFFYCHHIRTKQARLYEWSAELCLSGRVKIGWPGWIYVEGSSHAMEEFTKRVKAEHWRRIVPKWDEKVAVQSQGSDGLRSGRLFPDGMREVEAVRC